LPTVSRSSSIFRLNQVTTRLQFTDHDANEYELRPFQHNGNHYQNELLQGSQLGIDPLSSVK
jgi:hypothetical protein